MINLQYECCGTETYKDFQNEATVWDRTPGSISTMIDAPLICCKTIPLGGADNDVGCAREASKDIYTEVIIFPINIEKNIMIKLTYNSSKH